MAQPPRTRALICATMALLLMQATYADPVHAGTWKVRGYRARLVMVGKLPKVSVTLKIGPRKKQVPDIWASVWAEAGLRRRTHGRVDIRVSYPLK